jgi:hypothetical protein
MAYNFNGTNQYLNGSFSLIPPLTISCWARLSVITTNPALVSIQGTNLIQNGYLLGIRANSSLRFFTASNGVIGAATQPTPVVQNTWFHGAGVMSTLSNRTVYQDFINSGTNTTAFASAPPVDRFVIGAEFEGTPTASYYANGQIAEVGIWNVALTAAEIASLAKGMTCDKVRPQSLVFYAPLIRDLQDTKGGLIITPVNNPTVATHPRIYK